jgi:CubicO group peptidase (beta-lactamase class C family)
MKKYIYRKALHSSLAAIFLSFNASLVCAQGFSPGVQSRLQAVIDSFQNNPANPFIGGMSVAIKVDNLALWQGTTGFAARNVDAQNNLLPGGTPFTKQALSRIYSITKTFTAPLVLQLAKQKVFKLDDSVGKYVPMQSINPGLDGKVTIRQLLAHESGYSDYTDELNLQIAVAAQPTHVWTPFETLSFVHQVAARGAIRKYSSTNYITLGAIIETVTGKPVEDFYKKRFFRPLGLNSMYLAVRESPGRGVLASPHDNISAFNPVFEQTGQPTFPDAFTNISQFPLTAIASLAFTGGGIVSNAKDVADWSSDLFSGRATGKEILNTMLASISQTPDEDGDRLGYGVILSKKISSKYDFYGHDGNAPGYRSIMFYQPDKKLTLVILTNYHGADIYAIARALYAAIPDFTCGNKKGDKVQVCLGRKSFCVSDFVASRLIQYGAYLGDCNEACDVPFVQSNPKLQYLSLENYHLKAYPNPFRNQLSFEFTPSESGPASMRLFDMNNKLVATIFNGVVQKGALQQVKFDGGHLSGGIYISRLETPLGSTEQKLVHIR